MSVAKPLETQKIAKIAKFQGMGLAIFLVNICTDCEPRPTNGWYR